jgi:hypothetical protein
MGDCPRAHPAKTGPDEKLKTRLIFYRMATVAVVNTGRVPIAVRFDFDGLVASVVLPAQTARRRSWVRVEPGRRRARRLRRNSKPKPKSKMPLQRGTVAYQLARAHLDAELDEYMGQAASQSHEPVSPAEAKG